MSRSSKTWLCAIRVGRRLCRPGRIHASRVVLSGGASDSNATPWNGSIEYFWERQLMQAHEKLGDLTYKLHRLEAAKEHFDAMLDICRRHATTDSASKSVMRDLSVALKNGGLLLGKQRIRNCLAVFSRSLDSDRARSQKDETDPRIRVDIAVSLSNLATKLMQLDRERRLS